ncbi:MAG TPA: hemerythrin domain-containing protein [Candidatus Methylomirabilis sp.]|nr:hemerythrin domain-containing protein [Candidatus Methylomirabilis sp.]
MTTPDNPQSEVSPHSPARGDTATQILTREHGLILQSLRAMERHIAALETGGVPDRAFFENAIQFLRAFADRGHHGKEEDILFKRMVEDLDYPRNAGPVAVLTSEHERGREFLRGLAQALAVLGQDPAATQRVIENGRGYIQLLRTHIEREDNVVFPMVDQFLDDADQARLAAEFAECDRREMDSGRYEASLRLLQDLTQRTSERFQAGHGTREGSSE